MGNGMNKVGLVLNVSWCLWLFGVKLYTVMAERRLRQLLRVNESRHVLLVGCGNKQRKTHPGLIS